METTKITLATIKSFIRKNENNLFINVQSSYDGMIDACTHYGYQFTKAEKTNNFYENTLGIKGIWMVGGSRNYFMTYCENGYTGYYTSNCCGSFVIAIKS